MGDTKFQKCTNNVIIIYRITNNLIDLPVEKYLTHSGASIEAMRADSWYAIVQSTHTKLPSPISGRPLELFANICSDSAFYRCLHDLHPYYAQLSVLTISTAFQLRAEFLHQSLRYLNSVNDFIFSISPIVVSFTLSRTFRNTTRYWLIFSRTNTVVKFNREGHFFCVLLEI